ncbi:lipopolysaccharide biosynthesis protein [Eisenbergiella porci]|uniref:lipopolysaccharide biosynthesis protein n=1 Tax=Eisenbergiella porci TaxID=2652274 RepID=UPI0022E25A9D|nr:oligosaccharide flippase family protein [Eisenbergiella porci]
MADTIHSKNRSLMVGTITYAIGNFGTKILSFLIVPLYTYYIAPSEMGDYDLLMTTVSLLSPLLTMKISDATYRWIINDPGNRNASISATYHLLLRNCILFSAMLALLNLIVPIWNCPYFIAILVSDRILECLQKLLRGVKNQKLFAISGVFYTALMVTLNFIQVCILGQGVIALLQGVLISQIVTIILILIFEKRLRVYNKTDDRKKLQREMIRYSAPLVPSTLSWWVMSASDRYIIRWVLGSAANGLYAVAHKFPSILQIVFTMFNNAWTDLALGELSKGKENDEYTATVFEQLYKLSFGMTFVLIPATKVVTQLVFSESYKVASIYIGFLYLGTVFQGFSSFCSVGYLQGKKTLRAASSSIVGAIVNLIIDILLINYIGLFAAALSTFAGFFVMWIVRMHDIKKDYPIKINHRIFVTWMIACVMMATVTIWSNLKMDLILTLFASVVFILLNRKLIGVIIKKIAMKFRRM